jgi:RNA-directed DNA polymerase
MMNGDEKSDLTTVAIRTKAVGSRREKPANEPLRRGKERVEPTLRSGTLACANRTLGRVGAEGNVKDPHGVRAQDRAAPSSGIDRVREVAREKKGEKFTTLLHHVDAALLRQAYYWLKRDAAPGVDGVTWDAYGEGLEGRLRDLESRIHLGSYRAQPGLRAYIPKPDGRQRPLGIAALEDKVVQRAVVEVLNAIYEQDFVGFSYGFRPGQAFRSALADANETPGTGTA